MIDTTVDIVMWTAIALVPIAIGLIAIRVANQRQRQRSKHLRSVDNS